MVSFDPRRLDFSPYGFSCQRWAPSVMRRPDRHNEIELNFLSHGHLTYLFGGQVIRVEAPGLAAFWAAIPHQIIAHGPQNEYFVLTVPLGWFLRCKLSERIVQGLLHGRLFFTSCSERLPMDRRLFSDWEQDLAETDPTVRRAAHLEIEARLRRLAFACAEPPAVSSPHPKRQISIQDGGFAKAAQMAQLVAQRYTEELTVARFAQEMRLHRKLAMNLFHKIFGTTFVSYVTQHRISHAQRLLVTSEQSVVDVSAAAGFSSLSHFNRVFRQLCGCSPREYRKAHRLCQH